MTFDEKRLYTLSKDLINGHYQGPAAQCIDDLVDVLRFHEWKYAVQNNPIISDFEYDQLFAMLQELEKEHPELIDPNSPTQRVTSDSTSDFESVAHLSPMLSLANSYNGEDLQSFQDSILKILEVEAEAVRYVAEPKFDGGTVVLIYENDLLVRAATRGNGQKGDNITANVRTLRSVPLQAPFSKHGILRCELRGEAIIRKDNFAVINDRRAKEGLPLFANPRNAATGGLRMKTPADAARRGIEAFVFQMSHVDYAAGAQILTSHWDQLNLLTALGFKVPNDARKNCMTIEEVVDFAKKSELTREEYPYEIDGMVVKVDDLRQQSILGSTSHHPRWAIAFKFKAKQATTRLLQVEYQVGKIGSITPVAKLDPVQVAGVTVSSVSLHNEDFITERDLRLGDQVLVERAGDVIPYIVKAFPELRDGSEIPIEFPKMCPLNSHEQVSLVREADEAAWRCPSCSCGAQDLQRLIFHVSKPAMNIDGFGRAIVERFWDQGWIRRTSDIYNLDFDQVKTLEGFGERSAAKLETAINAAKSNPIHRLLHSLSIHHLGQRAAKILAEAIEHVLQLQSWTDEDFTQLKDIGPVVASNVMQFFADEKNIEELRLMESYGVNLLQTEADLPKELAEGVFSGKTILFTGTLQQMGRAEAKNLAESQGAKVLSGVSSKLDILVVGEKAGSKLKKAQTIGTVEILTEDQFLERIPDPSQT
ncbi:MAG: NAD-dependent DNA ligase LigA [Saprospiraceae bacterium]|nr:NAD-dependent DNA ligase LigA [Saprospiraceae bacterium]